MATVRLRLLDLPPAAGEWPPVSLPPPFPPSSSSLSAGAGDWYHHLQASVGTQGCLDGDLSVTLHSAQVGGNQAPRIPCPETQPHVVKPQEPMVLRCNRLKDWGEAQEVAAPPGQGWATRRSEY